MDNFIFISGGNDSIALIQYCMENDIKGNVVYSNTGWSHPFWSSRIEAVKKWLSNKDGYDFIETRSVGMEDLVKKKKGWPMAASKNQFCTQYLKIEPAKKLMNEIDESGDYDCYVGIRREESQNRASFPCYTESSEKHGGRSLIAPLVNLKEKERDELILKTPFKVLPHSSQECFPCVNANRQDFRELAEVPEKIKLISDIEDEMGFTKKGHPRVMFRPYRHMGATGIKEVVKWGLSDRGKYEPPSSCNSGFCGG